MVYNSQFDSNYAPASSSGGAIYLDIGSTVNFNQSLFSNNSVSDGGLSYESTMFTLSIQFKRSSPGSGGAIFSNTNIGGTIENCRFEANKAQYGGAISLLSGIAISNTVFSWNNSTAHGGIVVCCCLLKRF